jgi:gamma-glutamylcyclotransferase (GGCT)/AIG2-like uncharacterized protein YtfP
MSGNRERVFVYGTLRHGGSNHFRMAGSELVTPGTVSGKIYRISWYPGLVLGPVGEVCGEVYAVGEEQLRALDQFEGVSAGEIEGSEYRRVKAAVTAPDGSTVEAWVWEWVGLVDEARVVREGDWLLVKPGAE